MDSEKIRGGKLEIDHKKKKNIGNSFKRLF